MINLLPELPLPVPAANPARKPESGTLDFAAMLATPPAPAATSAPAPAPVGSDGVVPMPAAQANAVAPALPESTPAAYPPPTATNTSSARVRPTTTTLADLQPPCGLSQTVVVPGPRPNPSAVAVEPPATPAAPASDPVVAGSVVTDPVVTALAQSHHAPTHEGTIDLVTLPWRLRANAALSYRSTSVGNVGTAAMADSAHAPLVAGARWSGEFAARWPTYAWVNGEWQPTSTLPRPPFLPLPERPDHGWCGNADPAHVGHAPAWTFWSQRLLRWQPDREGEGVVARVRDFGFDPAQTQSLIDSLLTLAEQQDIPLRRIVLNGHEIWRADSSVS